MRTRRLLITFFSLLALIAIVFLLVPQEVPKCDLAVIFLGITNKPVRSRLEMFQTTTGLCAVFEVRSLATNRFIQNRFIQFEQEAIERREGGEWVTSSRTAKDTGIAGMHWTSGYKRLIALAWPAELPTNATWRVVLSVQRETGGFRLWVNNRTRRDIFELPTYGKHTVYSGEVEASVEFVTKK